MMSNPNRIVVPGEVVADQPVRAAYTYTDGVKTYATVMSLKSEDGKLIPLDGPYEPLPEDVVVGFVSEVKFAGYTMDLGGPYRAFLSSRDCRESFGLGDIVMARIIAVDEVKSIDLADGRRLREGRIETISPVKVPRLIGKKNSMINLIAQATACQLVVGRNGLVFVSHNGNHHLAHEAIRLIESQAHTSGLTDRVAAMLSAATGKTISAGMAMEGQLPPGGTGTPGAGAGGEAGPEAEGGYGGPGGGSGYGGPRREGEGPSGGYGHRGGTGRYGGGPREGGGGGFGGRRHEGGGGHSSFGHRDRGPRRR